MSFDGAVLCLALLALVACNSGDADASDAYVSETELCTGSSCCCKDGEQTMASCNADGRGYCAPGWQFVYNDCPYQHGLCRGFPDATIPDVQRDTRDEGADSEETCVGWDSDWGETPKADAPGATPCRSACDCPSGLHCCAATGGTVCAPASECP